MQMKNYPLRFGLTGGAISIALGLINWFTVAQMYGPMASQTLGYLTVVLALMFVPLGIKYFRDKENGGRISFGQGFRVGIGIVLVFSLMTYLYSVLFFILAGDAFTAWTQQGLTETEMQALEQRMLEAPAFASSPWFQSLLLSISVLIIGLVINFISAMILKRE